MPHKNKQSKLWLNRPNSILISSFQAMTLRKITKKRMTGDVDIMPRNLSKSASYFNNNNKMVMISSLGSPSNLQT